MIRLRLSRLVAFLLFATLCARAQDWGSPVWEDEFNGPLGSSLDASKWQLDVGDLKVNDEVEIYCPGFPFDHEQAKPRSPSAWDEITVCDPKGGNVSMDGQHLVLRAVEHNGTWTSGRVKTEGRQSFQYGRIEARIKMPFGAGLWPAFWALGDGIGKVGWPASGEIDFMENVPKVGGLGPSRIRSTIHGPGYSGDGGVRNDIAWTHGERVDTDYHLYGAIWSPYMIQFYVDDPSNVFFVVTPRELPVGKEWVYNQPFFLILNLAVGSARSWPGATDATTQNPATMLVDYVRVYKAPAIPGPIITTMPVTLPSGGAAKTPVKLAAKNGSGKMYLDCSTTAPGVSCSITPYVVDFAASNEATVWLYLTTQKSPIEKADVKVTAYTLSGDQSSGTAHLHFN